MPVAGSLSIQPFEVSRNGIVQLWVLNAELPGRMGGGPFTGVREQFGGQGDHDVERKRISVTAAVAHRADTPRVRPGWLTDFWS